MPRLITGLDAGRIAANLERVRETIADAGRDPATVEVLAAVKYVPIDEIDTLHEAGLTLLGENRAQELEDKATLHPGFRWHFIGQLQSRKVKQVLPFVELIHSVASESALKQLELHGTSKTEILLEVNVAREAGKAGIEPGEIPRYLEASTAKVVGLMTMPPFAENPETSRPHFARLAELAAEHGLPQLSMGTSQDFAVAAAEGATIVRIGTTLYT
ncbi:YggS family pyridoxal phosphate enzyme [Solirubrobacter ginsenosidimutans]|uniref:YggS family pyridoxal phosphate enzyme n=1 Tax=Solirubrobacter ginsenosidimutans TaxID=490573 RepID=A0A9X3MVZ7_9ACTN|nr:YggS family pyridoxal phosphate enzyme [Solirubrobacter ginsenosidimutans]MDA0163689.1 YggS family pyridoxal phosphate enzyme [Solirubrobacter ginsenosidimutans]